ncbi:hypothetical protein ACJX0J_029479 [Zea mays]
MYVLTITHICDGGPTAAASCTSSERMVFTENTTPPMKCEPESTKLSFAHISQQHYLGLGTKLRDNIQNKCLKIIHNMTQKVSTLENNIFEKIYRMKIDTASRKKCVEVRRLFTTLKEA